MELDQEFLDSSVRDYWRSRLAAHTHENYLSVGLSKFPEDLKIYEELIWESNANVVIEIGSHFGGSALWFRDRLRSMSYYPDRRKGKVVVIELNANLTRKCLSKVDPSWEEDIFLIEGSVLDYEVLNLVSSLVDASDRVFVVEDSAHVYETTYATLDNYAKFVCPGGYIVIEDGVVDIEELRLPGWPSGVIPAVTDWINGPNGSRFVVRRDLERYGLTCHVNGFIQRKL